MSMDALFSKPTSRQIKLILGFLILFPMYVVAKPIFEVTPLKPLIQVDSTDENVPVSFMVKNVSGHTIPEITFDFDYKKNPFLSSSPYPNDTFCKKGETLLPDEKCLLTGIITPKISYPQDTDLSTKFCGYQGWICSDGKAYINLNRQNIYAWIVMVDGILRKCDIDKNTGLFYNCTKTTASAQFSARFGNFYPGINSQEIFLGRSNSIERCLINNTTGDITNCNTAVTLPMDSYDFFFGRGNKFAYTTDLKNNKVWQCDRDDVSGKFTNCIDSKASLLSKPSPILINRSGTLAWIGNFSPGQSPIITVCDIDSTSGMLKNCRNSGATNIIQVTAMTNDNTGDFMFISGYSSGITRCNINKVSGNLSNCTVIKKDLSGPQDIIFTDDYKKSYIANYNGAPVVCNVNAKTKDFYDCQKITEAPSYNTLVLIH